MIRANHSDVLFLQSYVGTGATEEQFKTTLRMSGIKVVFRRDVDFSTACWEAERHPDTANPQR
jgi:hypothetical protein